MTRSSSAGGDAPPPTGAGRRAGSTGTSWGLRRGTPMATRAPVTRRPCARGSTVRSPARVSTRRAVSGQGTTSRSRANLAKQRMPLPHISASEPSGLNIRMRRSAFWLGRARAGCCWEGRAKIRPSAPTPKWRSHTCRARSGQSCSRPRASTTTKSLPAPCILANCMVISV